MITLRDINDNNFSIEIGEMVVCVETTEPQWYDVGDIFICLDRRGIKNIVSLDPTLYGGDYGRWEKHYASDPLEDLL